MSKKNLFIGIMILLTLTSAGWLLTKEPQQKKKLSSRDVKKNLPPSAVSRQKVANPDLSAFCGQTAVYKFSSSIKKESGSGKLPISFKPNVGEIYKSFVGYNRTQAVFKILAHEKDRKRSFWVVESPIGMIAALYPNDHNAPEWALGIDPILDAMEFQATSSEKIIGRTYGETERIKSFVFNKTRQQISVAVNDPNEQHLARYLKPLILNVISRKNSVETSKLDALLFPKKIVSVQRYKAELPKGTELTRVLGEKLSSPISGPKKWTYSTILTFDLKSFGKTQTAYTTLGLKDTPESELLLAHSTDRQIFLNQKNSDCKIDVVDHKFLARHVKVWPKVEINEEILHPVRSEASGKKIQYEKLNARMKALVDDRATERDQAAEKIVKCYGFNPSDDAFASYKQPKNKRQNSGSPLEIYFAFDQTQVENVYLPALEEIVGKMNANKDLRLVLKGYSSVLESYRPEHLARKRIYEIENYFGDSFISKNRISTYPFGSRSRTPKLTGNCAEKEKKKRVVEVTLEDSSQL